MNILKHSHQALAALALTAGLVSSAASQAGDYDWIEPSAYTFGSCGGVGGDSVPGYLNQRYYTRYTCREALDVRKCYVQAQWYEKQLRDEPGCGAWLRQELSKCERVVSREAENCDNLAK